MKTVLKAYVVFDPDVNDTFLVTEHPGQGAMLWNIHTMDPLSEHVSYDTATVELNRILDQQRFTKFFAAKA